MGKMRWLQIQTKKKLTQGKTMTTSLPRSTEMVLARWKRSRRRSARIYFWSSMRHRSLQKSHIPLSNSTTPRGHPAEIFGPVSLLGVVLGPDPPATRKILGIRIGWWWKCIKRSNEEKGELTTRWRAETVFVKEEFREVESSSANEKKRMRTLQPAERTKVWSEGRRNGNKVGNLGPNLGWSWSGSSRSALGARQ